ncbi:MAG TPA: hypothetical protein VJJ82_04735 [Candidatus Nanoarchaeia archaeon]|nr:hypothetical protein [Candidatus Nanoarchaeia archaeon]
MIKWITDPKESDELFRKIEQLFEEDRKRNPNGVSRGLSAWFKDTKKRKRVD